ncbi:MAG: pyridoxamine 5'-phosphate oxidase family protein [Caldilineales bacterium]|nr:pyridoxamine 5'-phosphate oxidase family protein [Caldilineales bacterium]
MLEHLRRKVASALAQVQSATLATYGPADIQATVVPCEAVQDALFLLVPCSSDHLFNIEHNPSVVVTTAGWQLNGRAQMPTPPPAALGLYQRPEINWSLVIEVVPERLNITPEDFSQPRETIDLI